MDIFIITFSGCIFISSTLYLLLLANNCKKSRNIRNTRNT